MADQWDVGMLSNRGTCLYVSHSKDSMCMWCIQVFFFVAFFPQGPTMFNMPVFQLNSFNFNLATTHFHCIGVVRNVNLSIFKVELNPRRSKVCLSGAVSSSFFEKCASKQCICSRVIASEGCGLFKICRNVTYLLHLLCSFI